jgi:hypothetical protein
MLSRAWMESGNSRAGRAGCPDGLCCNPQRLLKIAVPRPILAPDLLAESLRTHAISRIPRDSSQPHRSGRGRDGSLLRPDALRAVRADRSSRPFRETARLTIACAPGHDRLRADDLLAVHCDSGSDSSARVLRVRDAETRGRPITPRFARAGRASDLSGRGELTSVRPERRMRGVQSRRTDIARCFDSVAHSTTLLRNSIASRLPAGHGTTRTSPFEKGG